MGAYIEIAVIALLVLGNGVFAMAEIAVVSARRERLSAMAEEGKRGAAAAIRLAEDPNRFLATVQIGITVIGILSGAFGGATLANRLATVFDDIPAISAYSQPLSFGIVVVSIAYLSLVVGEIVPKRLGLRNPELISTGISRPMAVLSMIAAPAVSLIGYSTNLVLSLLRAREPVDRPITEEEIKALMSTGVEAGAMQTEEREMVAGVFRLTDRPVQVFMTPRQEIIWLDHEDPPEAVRDKLMSSVHSRLPVCSGELDNVTGMVAAKDLLSHCLAGRDMDLRAAARPVLFIPETSTGPDALRLMEEGGHSAGMVVDENGGIEGMVTLADFLDEITGAMSPIHHEEFERRGDAWSIDGKAGLDEVTDVTGIHVATPEGESDSYYTLGGFVMARLGRMPKAGDEFDWDDVRYKVERMVGRRVDRVTLHPILDQTPENIID